MPTTSPREKPVASLYVQALHELAELIGLEPSEILETASVEADGMRFYFQDHAEDEGRTLSVLAELGEIPAVAEPEILRQLLEANSHLAAQSGSYVLIPGTSRAALRMHVQLEEGAPNGERVLDVLKGHLATCSAVRHLGTHPVFESRADMVDSALA
ncbi:hypothetical protein WDL1CHR_05711 [Variovorax sp. WDL1]|nr:hypothetical protein APY03_2901 [Variovorax sp. WDL1]PNG47386.1 hypothetical protein CHC06_07736 [Variovorax sp. B2]PNG47963.1 hypothetical protein CHC07_07132 [Variovorax sp. B4]VTV15293.1 hypothetical protein WDL1CHR_05711 [Variovorax sp. WDL1]